MRRRLCTAGQGFAFSGDLFMALWLYTALGLLGIAPLTFSWPLFADKAKGFE